MNLTEEELKKFEEYDNYRSQMHQAEMQQAEREARRELDEEIAVLERILWRLKASRDWGYPPF